MNSKFDLRSGSIFRSLGKSNSGIPRRKRKFSNVTAAKIKLGLIRYVFWGNCTHLTVSRKLLLLTIHVYEHFKA